MYYLKDISVKRLIIFFNIKLTMFLLKINFMFNNDNSKLKACDVI